MSSYQKIKKLSDEHPELTKKWRAKHKGAGYPPLKYWEKKGYYTAPMKAAKVPRVRKEKQTAAEKAIVSRLRADAKREHLLGENVTLDMVNRAKAHKHPHYLHHIEGKKYEPTLLHYKRTVASDKLATQKRKDNARLKKIKSQKIGK